MISGFFSALAQSVLPIAVTSFVLVWWALKKDYLEGVRSMEQYAAWQKAKKQQKKEKKKLAREARKNPDQAITEAVESLLEPEKPRKFDPLHSKWMKFGGGFYGVVAFYTYILVELPEVRDFLLSLDALFRGEIINLIIRFFIESIKNFVVAIAWPAYWLQRIHSDPWLWAIGAYAGYWLGARAAFRISADRAVP